MWFVPCLELAFDAVNLIGFNKFSYEGTLLYEFILMPPFQERFGYRDIRRKVDFAPRLMGNGACVDQFSACQLIYDCQIPGFQSGLMPQCLFDCTAEQLRSMLAECDQPDRLAVDLIRP